MPPGKFVLATSGRRGTERRIRKREQPGKSQEEGGLSAKRR